MQVTIDIPDEAVTLIEGLHFTASEYVSEIMRVHVEGLLAGPQRIEDRPDWQAAILRGRAEIARGHGVPDEVVAAWHLRHLE